MQVYWTNGVQSQFSPILLYGPAGAGKTPMAASLPDPIVISSEPGLKSLQRYKIPYVVARNATETNEAIAWARSRREYKSIFFDGISATSENIIREERRKSNDPRKFSPATTAAVMDIVFSLLTINDKNIVITTKSEEEIDGVTGIRQYRPFCVVPKLGPQLPYHFDNVLFIKRYVDPQSGQEYAALTCRANNECIARNRGDMLALYEPADLGKIIQKLNGVQV